MWGDRFLKDCYIHGVSSQPRHLQPASVLIRCAGDHLARSTDEVELIADLNMALASDAMVHAAADGAVVPLSELLNGRVVLVLFRHCL